MLPALLVLALSAAPGGSRTEMNLPAPAARVEIFEGRAALALPEGVLRLTPHSPPQSFSGPVHMEVSPSSRVRVQWSGLSSLLIEGGTVVEWDPPDTRSGDITCRFSRVDSTHVEVRRGRLSLELPQGWSADVQAGACFVRGIAGSNVELEHDAGLPISLWAPSADGSARPPFTILAGSHLRLLGDARRPLALSGTWPRVLQPHGRMAFEAIEGPEDAQPWEGFEWPWGDRPKLQGNETTPTPLRKLLAPWEFDERLAFEGSEGGTLDLPDARAARPPGDEQVPGTKPETSALTPSPQAGSGSEAPALDPATTAPEPVAPGAAGADAEPSPQKGPEGSPPAGQGSTPRPGFEGFLPDFSNQRLVLTPYGARWVQLEDAPEASKAPEQEAANEHAPSQGDGPQASERDEKPASQPSSRD